MVTFWLPLPSTRRYHLRIVFRYDPSNAVHRLAKKKIEEGDGLPDMCLTSVCDQAAKEVGFTKIESRDTALDQNPNGEDWYTVLSPSYFSLFRLQFTYIGTLLMNIVLNFMEYVRLAPKGSGDVREMLRQAQLGLVSGGEDGTFTPMYMVLVEKPRK